MRKEFRSYSASGCLVVLPKVSNRLVNTDKSILSVAKILIT